MHFIRPYLKGQFLHSCIPGRQTSAHVDTAIVDFGLHFAHLHVGQNGA